MIDGFSTIRKYSSPRILKSVTNLVTYRTESRDAIASKKQNSRGYSAFLWNPFDEYEVWNMLDNVSYQETFDVGKL